MSILIAIFGGIVSAGTGMFLAFTSFAMQIGKISPAAFAPPTGAAAGDEDDDANLDANLPEDGLAKPQRDTITATMNHVRPMTDLRRRQLDKLLATAGQTMFPFAADGVSTGIVRNNISESGVIPSPIGGMGPHYFVIGQGRIEVYDDHALFRPDGPGEVVSVSAKPPPAMTPKVTPYPPGTPSAPGARPGPRGSSASPRANPRAPFATRTGPRGSATIPPTPPGAPIPPRTPGPNPFANLKVSPWALSLAGIEAGFSAMLAILLLIAGIMTLRGSPASARLHWIYILFKIPLAILGAIGLAFVICEFSTTVSPSSPSWTAADTTRLAWASAAALAIVFLLYPVVLAVALRSKKLRAFFAADIKSALL